MIVDFHCFNWHWVLTLIKCFSVPVVSCSAAVVGIHVTACWVVCFCWKIVFCKILFLFYPSKHFVCLAFGVVTDASCPYICFLLSIFLKCWLLEISKLMKWSWDFSSMIIVSTSSNKNACKVLNTVLCCYFELFCHSIDDSNRMLLRNFCNSWDTSAVQFVSLIEMWNWWRSFPLWKIWNSQTIECELLLFSFCQ